MRAQTRTVLPWLVVTATGEPVRWVQATALTPLSWPMRVARRSPVVRSHDPNGLVVAGGDGDRLALNDVAC